MLTRILQIIIAAFFQVCFCLQVFAQPDPPFFVQHYDNRNGLSNSSINHIFKDSGNLLWVATWDGLNMYDGNIFHVFNYSKENNPIAKGFKSIGSNVIQQVAEDKHGNIWVTTIEGISRYEKRSGRFFNYFYNQDQRSKVSEQEYALAIDTAGKVYCLNQKTGLSCYDEKADSFLSCKLPLQHAATNKIAFDETNQLWLLNAAGQLDVYAESKHEFKAVQSYREKEAILNFFNVNQRLFFTTSSNQLFVIQQNLAAPQQVMQLDHTIGALIYYKKHYLLAWASKGYAVFDGSFKPSSFLKEETHQMQDIKVTSWALGSEDILWYGTDGNGLIKIYPKTKSFVTVTTSENGMPYNKSVRAFDEVDGNLWIGTKGSGIINIPHFRTGQSLNARQYFLAPAELDNNSCNK